MSNCDPSNSTPSLDANAEGRTLEINPRNATEIESEIPSQVDPPPLPSEQRSANEPSQASTNYFLRHWNGDLPLGISYWCNGVCLSVILTMLSASVSELEEKISLKTGALLVALIYLITIILGVWQIVGTWRSASKHVNRGGEMAWAAIAKVIVFGSALRLFFLSINTLIPQGIEFGRIAMGDAKMPPYTINLLANRTEMEFRGGLRAGCAEDFRRVLESNAQVRVLHINSVGGRLREAKDMAKMVKERKLITYTQDGCSSAATIVFLSGVERVCNGRAKIGFHRGTMPGQTRQQLKGQNDQLLEMFRSAGVSDAFARRVLDTPPSEMWFPTIQEMRDAGVITSRSFGDRFGVSGEMLQQSSVGSLDRSFSSFPLYREIKRLEPAVYAEVLREISESIQNGSTEGAAMAKARVRLESLAGKYLAKTSDKGLFSMRESWIELLGALKDTDENSAICITIIAPQLNTGKQNYASMVPPQAITNLLASFAFMLSEAGVTNQPVNVAAGTEDVEKLMENLRPKYGDNLDLLADPSQWMSRPKIVCEMMFSLYTETKKFPAERQGNLLRHLLSVE